MSVAPIASAAEVRSRIRDLIAEFFDCPVDRIRDETVASDVDGWNSTSHVGLILEIEDALGAEFDIERISAFNNIGELLDECVLLAGSG